MKTLEDLNKMIPAIVEQIASQEHIIGESYMDYEENCFFFEENGWSVEITYECCGEWESDPGDYWNPSYCELIRAKGRVTGIIAVHFDEETEEETEFSKDDLKELWKEINDILADLA